MRGVVKKAFPFAFDGINIQQIAAGTDFPPAGFTIADGSFSGLVDAGYIERQDNADLPPEETLNRRIIEAMDRRLAAASDQDLKDIIARSGTPFSGNLVHAQLVFAAKEQMLREMEGATPARFVDPNAGVTEQPLAKPGEATPTSAAAAVERQQAHGDAAKKAAEDDMRDGHNKVADVNLDEMTVAELKEHAELNKIDIGDATKKADIIAAIQAAKK